MWSKAGFPAPVTSGLKGGYTLARLCVAVCALLWVAEDGALGVSSGCSGSVGGVTPGTYGGGSGSTGGTSPTGTLVPPTPPPPPNPNAPIPPIVPPEPGESCSAGGGPGTGPAASCTPVLTYNGQCSLSMWPNSCVWWSALNPFVNNNPAYVYQGDQCSFGIHYGRCSYPPESCSTSTIDGYVNIDIDRGCMDTNLWAPHILVTGYVYIGNFGPGAVACPAQRKLIYIQSQGWGDGPPGWGAILDTFCDAGQTSMQLTYAPTGPGNAAGTGQVWNIATLNFNQWYEVGIELKMNSQGQNDGYANVFVNGQQVYYGCGQTAVWNGTNTNPIGQVIVGEQIDANVGPTNPSTYDEYRYWDNVTISKCTP
jgi:hypothetical protein